MRPSTIFVYPSTCLIYSFSLSLFFFFLIFFTTKKLNSNYKVKEGIAENIQDIYFTIFLYCSPTVDMIRKIKCVLLWLLPEIFHRFIVMNFCLLSACEGQVNHIQYHNSPFYSSDLGRQAFEQE